MCFSRDYLGFGLGFGLIRALVGTGVSVGYLAIGLEVEDSQSQNDGQYGGTVARLPWTQQLLVGLEEASGHLPAAWKGQGTG